jgi:hypothetical protein
MGCSEVHWISLRNGFLWVNGVQAWNYYIRILIKTGNMVLKGMLKRMRKKVNRKMETDCI